MGDTAWKPRPDLVAFPEQTDAPGDRRFGWVTVPVRVTVRVNFVDGAVDRVHMGAETNGTCLPLGPGESHHEGLRRWAEGDSLTQAERAITNNLVNSHPWAVLSDLPDTITWEDD